MQISEYQINKQKTKKRYDYFLLYCLISLGSMPFFIGNQYLFIFFAISIILFIIEKHRIDNYIIYYSIIFVLIFLAQSIYFSVIEPDKIFAYLIRIFFAYFTFKILGKNITKYFVNIIYFFTIISLFFYFLTFLFPTTTLGLLENMAQIVSKLQLNNPGRTHIIIYTFGESYAETSGFVDKAIPRNSGPFWEPGGYGIFILMAIAFELIERKKILTKKNIILILGLVTTLSTASFFSFFILLLFYVLFSNNKFKLVFLSIIVLTGILIYLNSFFLTMKIERDLNIGDFKSLDDAPRNRFVSALLDINDFKNYPIIGKGRYEATRFDVKTSITESSLNHRNNGSTNLLVEFGLIGFIVFFTGMFMSFKNYCMARNVNKNFALFLTVFVLILGFSQMIFNKPLFIGLSFIFLADKTSLFMKKWAT